MRSATDRLTAALLTSAALWLWGQPPQAQAQTCPTAEINYILRDGSDVVVSYCTVDWRQSLGGDDIGADAYFAKIIRDRAAKPLTLPLKKSDVRFICDRACAKDLPRAEATEDTTAWKDGTVVTGHLTVACVPGSGCRLQQNGKPVGAQSPYPEYFLPDDIRYIEFGRAAR